MIRIGRASLLAVVALCVALTMGCQPKVEVKTGSRLVCTEGHGISESIKTIEVPANEISDYRVKTVVKTCDEHAAVLPLYEQAQVAIADGDLKTAEEKLAQVVAADPAFRKAKSQLDSVKAGQEPAVDNEEPAPPTDTTQAPDDKPGEGDTSAPAGSLLKWAPDSVRGYTATKPTIDLLNIAREYVPESASGPVSFVIVAEQTKTAVGAESALKTQVKQQYPADTDTITINGRKAYFGTNNRYAAIGFTDGSVMVALEMSVKPGDSPKSLKKALVAAAEQLP